MFRRVPYLGVAAQTEVQVDRDGRSIFFLPLVYAM